MDTAQLLVHKQTIFNKLPNQISKQLLYEMSIIKFSFDCTG